MEAPDQQGNGKNSYQNSPTTSRHAEPEPPSISKTAFTLLICAFAGIVFGFASEKGRVFEPINIRYQMVFKRWIMMKMFLSAMAAGALSFSVLSLLPISFVQRQISKAASDYEMVLAEKHCFAIALGAVILGVGMTLAGAQCLVFTLIGALCGSLIYGLVHDHLYEKIFPSSKLSLPSSFSKLTGIRYPIVSFPMAVVVYALVVVLEVVVDWRKDVNFGAYVNQTSYVHGGSQSAPSVFQLLAWPPSVCGTLIGLMQVPVVLAAGDTLGGSSSYCTVTSQIMCTSSLRQKFPYLANFQSGIGNWWQVLYVTSAVAGGAISSLLSKSIGDVAGVPVAYALTGGFCLLFGARLASGCTSGHGLSGAGLLFLGSFLAVPCMFGGAICTAFIMQAIGQLDNLY